VTNNRKPISGVSGQEDKILLQEFNRLEIRGSVAVPTRTQPAKTTVDALFYNFIIRYGPPLRLHTDRGDNLKSTVIRELCQMTGMAKYRTTPYHATGNGLTERMNRTLPEMLGTMDPSRKREFEVTFD